MSTPSASTSLPRPQAKQEICKLKKYLNHQKRVALAGPPPSQTTSMLQSLLDGDSKKTRRKSTTTHNSRKARKISQSETGKTNRKSSGGEGSKVVEQSRNDNMWAKVDLNESNKRTSNVFSSGTLDDLLPSTLVSSSMKMKKLAKRNTKNRTVIKAKTTKAVPTSTREITRRLTTLPKAPKISFSKNLPLRDTSTGVVTKSCAPSKQKDDQIVANGQLSLNLPGIGKKSFLTSMTKKKARIGNRFSNGEQTRRGYNNSNANSSSSSLLSKHENGASQPDENSKLSSNTSTSFQLPPIHTVNGTTPNIPEIKTILPPMNNAISTAPIHKHAEFKPFTATKPMVSEKKLSTTSKKRKSKSSSTNNDNFVKLNLRNNAGSCRGARNLKTHNRQKRWKARIRGLNGDFNRDLNEDGREQKKTSAAAFKQKKWKQMNTIHDAIDPIDDFLDGTFHNGGQTPTPTPAKTKVQRTKEEEGTQTVVTTKEKEKDGQQMPQKIQRTSSHPLCTRHNRQCKILVVKKNTTGNKGRKFYVCSMPRGEQCDFFQWEDDTVQAARSVLESSTQSGFIARQVAGHIDRFKALTVPELRVVAKKRKLNTSGTKKAIIARLSVWVRDQICKDGNELDEVLKIKPTSECDDGHNSDESSDSEEDEDDVDDDYSTSSEELEICGPLGSIPSQSDKSSDCCNEGSNVDNPKSLLHKSLFDLFGYSTFRDGQEWAIRRCLAHEKTLLVAPTGMGKSLCYALPAALMDGVCIVISPLISLIEDQLRHLPPRIPSATLSGNKSKKEMALTIDDLLQGRLKILFVSPEKLTSAAFRRLLRPKYDIESKTYKRQLPPVSLLCLDEAHCLSQWGHNFRSSYLRIRAIINSLDPKSVLALTATAGPPVINDICRTLRISQLPIDSDESTETSVKVLNCNRDNIDVSALFLHDEDQRLRMLLKLIQAPSNRQAPIGVAKGTALNDNSSFHDKIEGCLSKGSVIVYVWRKKDAEVLTEQLVGSGLDGGVVCYHGGMDSGSRSKAQAKFMRGKARICVATVAFGLGINKVDVRGVIHLCLPSSPENYSQEIGRAGRDGSKAQAVALVTENEIAQKHSLAFSNKISTSQIQNFLSNLQYLTKEAFKDYSDISSNGHIMYLNVAIPMTPMINSSDLKEETILTILSMLEDDTPGSSKMLDIHGIIPDSATVTLKRRSIEDLASTEAVGRCILTCGTKIDTRSTNSSSQAEGGTAMQKGFGAYSFGTIEFSVVQCSRLLGPNAEPRNIYAALRRLQSMGELELTFNYIGKSVYVRLNKEGIHHFNETYSPDSDIDRPDEMTRKLCEYFSDQDTNQCAKVLEMQHMFHKISSISTEDDTLSSQKTERLELFQGMMKDYFTQSANQEEKDFKIEKKILLIDENDKATLRFLSNDVLSLLQNSTMPEPCSYFPSRVQFGDIKYADYTTLLITKILHGIPSPSTPSLEWYSHLLWGKWKLYNFQSLHTHVTKVVEQSLLIK